MTKKTKISCNKCGKTMKYVEGVLKEDFFEATKEWGYFSTKDLEMHKFNLCEKCYDKLVEEFVIPISIMDKKEAL